MFSDTWASPWVAPTSQPAGHVPSRYHLMSPSHLCALCWLQAGTGLTHSQAEGLTQGGGPGGGSREALRGLSGTPRRPHSLSVLIRLGLLLWSCPLSLPPKCGHQTQSVWKQAWHWLRATGQPAMAFTPAHHGLNTEPSWTSADWPRGQPSPPRHTQLQDQEPAGGPARQPQGAGRCGSVCPGQGPRGARAWRHP